MTPSPTGSPRRAALVLAAFVRAYQLTISPLLVPRCRFEPSCSAYAYEALVTQGPIRGLRLAVWRLLRCQPFARPGYDPVPDPRPAREGEGQGRTGTDRRTGRRVALRGTRPC